MPTTTTTSLPALAADLPRTARRVLALLQHLRYGSLDLQTPEGDLLHFGNEQQPRAAIRISDWAVCDAALKSGDVGFAESFMAGHWTSPDLSAARVFVSVLGTPSEQEDAIAGLRSSRGLLQAHVASELRMKRTPTLNFVHDDTPERGARIERLIADVAPGEEEDTDG